MTTADSPFSDASGGSGNASGIGTEEDLAAEAGDSVPPEAGLSNDSVPESDPGRSDDQVPESEPRALEPSDPFEELARERDDFKDALIRLQADFENYKKRVAKQETEQRDRATQALIEKLLPVLDTADLAVAHGAGEEVTQITTALASALEHEGLERIDPEGGPFDPTLHDAVAHEPGESGEQEVIDVLRAGYRWKGRVVRPAMVKVKG